MPDKSAYVPINTTESSSGKDDLEIDFNADFLDMKNSENFEQTDSKKSSDPSSSVNPLQNQKVFFFNRLKLVLLKNDDFANKFTKILNYMQNR